ncbi:MAG: hypothetical protein LBL86_02710 [Coriobacteriales bacterium]|jgi:uncharacterized surface anchored protein|nr:hypothetical protein [Coriobacteriales bacterium]
MDGAKTYTQRTLRTLCALLVAFSLLPAGTSSAFADDADAASGHVGTAADEDGGAAEGPGLAGIDGEQLVALGGREALADALASHLGEGHGDLVAVVLESFEEVGGVARAVFLLGGGPSFRIAVSYTAADGSYAFEELGVSDEEEGGLGSGDGGVPDAEALPADGPSSPDAGLRAGDASQDVPGVDDEAVEVDGGGGGGGGTGTAAGEGRAATTGDKDEGPSLVPEDASSEKDVPGKGARKAAADGQGLLPLAAANISPLAVAATARTWPQIKAYLDSCVGNATPADCGIFVYQALRAAEGYNLSTAHASWTNNLYTELAPHIVHTDTGEGPGIGTRIADAAKPGDVVLLYLKGDPSNMIHALIVGDGRHLYDASLSPSHGPQYKPLANMDDDWGAGYKSYDSFHVYRLIPDTGTLRIEKSIIVDPATLDKATYSLENAAFLLSTSSARPAGHKDSKVIARFDILSNKPGTDWQHDDTGAVERWYIRPTLTYVEDEDKFGGLKSTKLTGIAPGTYYLHEFMTTAYKMTTAGAWKDRSDAFVEVTIGAGKDASFRFNNSPKGYIDLVKSSSAPAHTTGNSDYSLEGAVYRVYPTREAASEDTGHLASIVTDKAGKGRSTRMLDAAVYYLKEVTAPKGFALSTAIHSVKLEAGTVFVCKDAVDKPLGRIELQKASSLPALSSGNAGYTLAGAVYGIYKTRATALADTERVARMTTDAGGFARSGLLAQRTYYVKELTAPAGFALDTRAYRVVVADATPVPRVDSLEVPWSDSLGISVQKLDKETGKAWGRDDATGASLAGAQFTIRYYDGQYSTAAEAEASGAATRRWVVETKAGGAAVLDASHLVAGSNALYLDGSARPVLPLGTFLVQETKAPSAYLLPSPNPVSLIRVSLENGAVKRSVVAGGTAVQYAANALQVSEQPRSLRVCKRDATSAAPLAGAVFALYRESAPGSGVWTEVMRKTAGTDGTVGYSPLAAGSYKVVEAKAPEGYQLPSEAGMANERLFAVGASSTEQVVELVFNDYPKVQPALEKRDAASGASLPGAELSLYSYPVTMKDGFVATDVSGVPSDGPRWAKVATAVTDAKGKASFPRVGFGYYKVVETKAPEGYMLPSEAGFSDVQAFKVDAGNMHPLLLFTDYRKPDVPVEKHDAESGEALPGAEFSLYRYPVTMKDGRVATDVSAVLAGDPGWSKVGTVTTGADGKAVFPRMSFGYYRLVEDHAPKGYLLPSETGFSDARLFKLEADDTQLVLVFTDFDKPDLPVEKRDAEGGGALSGAEFALYSYPVALSEGLIATDTASIAEDDPAWAWVGTATSDAEGCLVFEELGFGYYKLVETKAPEGYLLPSEAGFSDAQTFKVEMGSTKPALLFTDYRKPDLPVEKHDAKDGGALSGAEFALYSYPVALSEGLVADDPASIAADDPAWAQVGTAVSDAEGCLAFEGLLFGYYRLVETKAPEGYLLPSEAGFPDAQTLKVDAGNTRPFLLFTDHPRPDVPVEKRDAKTQAPLAGAGFSLYSYPIEMREGLVATDTAAIAADDPAWAQVGTAVSDEDGSLCFAGLSFGYYRLVEEKAPEGYLLPSEAGFSDACTFMLEVGNTQPDLLFTDYDRPDVPVEKRDADTQAPVGDTEFALLSYPVEMRDGRIGTDVSSVTADDPAWTERARLVTDAEGRLRFTGLPFGYYQLKETRPNPLYASFEESGGTDRFVALDKDAADEVQVFEDKAIQLGCEVYEDTVNITSAGLQTSDEDYLRVENVGAEAYHYTLDFRSTSNVRADEFTVIDTLESVVTGGVRLQELFTPVARGDSDGLFNLWYRTNLTDTSRTYSTESAMGSNPHNANNPQREQRWPSVGWQLWKGGVPTTHTTRLSVRGLGLAPNEHLTALRFEYGSVEAGFTTRDTVRQALQEDKGAKPTTSDWSEGRPGAEDDGGDGGTGPQGGALSSSALRPATYLVTCSTALLPPSTIRDRATVGIARNVVLSDEDEDRVSTAVIGPFMVSTSPGEPTDITTLEGYVAPEGTALPSTGELLAIVACMFATALLLLAGLFLARRAHASHKKKG